MDAAMGMGLTMDNVAIFWMRILSIVFVFGIIAVWCVWPYLPRKTTMRHTLHTILASVALVAVFGIVLPVQAQDSDLKAAKPTAISTAIERKEVMRDLWVEHIFWIRNVVIESAIAKDDDSFTCRIQFVAPCCDPVRERFDFFAADLSGFAGVGV